jgi:hypothetical protein
VRTPRLGFAFFDVASLFESWLVLMSILVKLYY